MIQKVRNMNALELSTVLRSMCRNDLDRQIVDNAIMRCYMCLSDFYPDHAFTALCHFKKTGILILSVYELTKMMRDNSVMESLRPYARKEV